MPSQDVVGQPGTITPINANTTARLPTPIQTPRTTGFREGLCSDSTLGRRHHHYSSQAEGRELNRERIQSPGWIRRCQPSNSDRLWHEHQKLMGMHPKRSRPLLVSTHYGDGHSEVTPTHYHDANTMCNFDFGGRLWHGGYDSASKSQPFVRPRNSPRHLGSTRGNGP